MKVIKIGAVWCPGCLVMGPRWQEIEAELPWLQTEYYDFDQNKEQMGRFNAVSDRLPVFIFIDKEDREIFRMTGEVSKEELIQAINDNKDR